MACIFMIVLLCLPSWAADCLPVVEQRSRDLSNEARRRAGVPPLSAEATLEAIARRHSLDMLARSYFGHASPDGESSGDRVAKGHRWFVGLVGENLFRRSGSYPRADADRRLAGDMVDGWMSSAGHRKNLLDRDFTHFGIGVCRQGSTILATQVFGMMKALTVDPVPLQVSQQQVIHLDFRLDSGLRRPELFDLWSVRKQAVVMGPVELRDRRLDVEPGIYRLRFYFKSRGDYSYEVFYGPQIEVLAEASQGESGVRRLPAVRISSTTEYGSTSRAAMRWP